MSNYPTTGITGTTANIIAGPTSSSYYYQQPTKTYEYSSTTPVGYATNDSTKYQTTRTTGYSTAGYATTGATGYTTGTSEYTASIGVSGQRATAIDIPV